MQICDSSETEAKIIELINKYMNKETVSSKQNSVYLICILFPFLSIDNRNDYLKFVSGILKDPTIKMELSLLLKV